jgi:hypothetical protein
MMKTTIDLKTLKTALDSIETDLNNLRVYHSTKIFWKDKGYGTKKVEGKELRAKRLKNERKYIAAIKKLREALRPTDASVDAIPIEDIGTKKYWDRNKVPQKA